MNTPIKPLAGDLFRPATWPEGIEHHRAVLRCQECWALECVEFLLPSDREAGMEQLRWHCTRCDALLNDDGERVGQGSGKQVAA